MTDREHLLRRNILRALAACGDYLILAAQLQAEVGLLTPRLAATEFDDALQSAEDARQVTSVESERGRKYKINDAGRAWLSENRF